MNFSLLRCPRGSMRIGRAVFVIAMALAFSPQARAVLPLPTYPECGMDNTTRDCPPDITRSDGTLNGDAWALLNYMPAEATEVRPQERPLGSGSWTTAAWRKTTGRFDVTIAVLDCGIRWREDSLTNKVLLNIGELPPPIGPDGTVCADYDCDGNGLVNVQDYGWDDRVFASAGHDSADNRLDPSDLIAIFSDGVDDDGNGYIDDIAGWDFFWDDNDPATTNDFYHMTSVLTEAAAEGGEPQSDIGHCPNCSVLPVRVSDSFVGEGDKIAEAIIYAVDQGVEVIGMALGSMSNPEVIQDAMRYAWERGTTIVAAAGDELGYHHNYPAANDHAIYVHSIKYYPAINLETARSVLGYIGCNNFGARLDAVAASNACATGSVAATIGMAGLVYSRGRDLGIDLSPAEVRQLLLRTADDIDVPESHVPYGPYFPSYPGWDQFFGYGRINAGKAVDRISDQTIPPEIELRSPGWFEYFDPREDPRLEVYGTIAASRAPSYDYEIAWAPGVDPRENDFIPIVHRSDLTEPTDGFLGALLLTSIDPELLDAKAPVQRISGRDTPEKKSIKINAHSLTLRVRAVDAWGNMAEERKQVFVIEDSDLVPGFPIHLAHSGESSPVLFDLNQDGKLDIVMADSNGDIHAFDATAEELPGWPVHTDLMPGIDPNNPQNHLDADAYAGGAIPPTFRQGVIGTVAVGDLEGDGIADVVAGTIQGQVFAFSADGSLKPGFPVFRDPVDDSDTNEMVWRDPGMFASTVLFDLDQDGNLEIIQASMDQKVYVWRFDGSRQPGFPVLLENPDGSTGVTTKCGRIVSSPAVGDLEGNGKIAIVVGTNEFKDDQPYLGLAYAIRAEGNLSPGGPFVTGWPVDVLGLASGIINYVGEGITPSASLADVDHDRDLEILISGVGSFPVLLNHDGTLYRQLGYQRDDLGANSNSDERVFVAVISNGAFADYDGGGDLEVMMGGSGLTYFESLAASRYLYFDHLATAWKARTGKMLDAFPRVIEDIGFFNSPAAGDVDGDGMPEMLIGTSGYILHAFDTHGDEPDGWPKLTGGWLIASPAVGDIDGDGRNEVVVPTREGYLFAWNTDGIGGLEWPSFRHDPQNTGNYQVVGAHSARTPALRPAATSDGNAAVQAAGCSVRPTGSRNGTVGLGWMILLGLTLPACRVFRSRNR